MSDKPTTSEPEPIPPQAGPSEPARSAPSTVPAAAAGGLHQRMPDYRGGELDAERGPGLGCFWIQVILLVFFFVLTPVTVELAWPPIVSAILLFVTIGLLLFVGQTVIFLLRIVAAERRGRRRPVAARTRTVGEIEDATAAEMPIAATSMDAPAAGGGAAGGGAAGGGAAGGGAATVSAETSTAASAGAQARDAAHPGSVGEGPSGDGPSTAEGMRQ